jgi:polysaccharide deacetylase family protein (PEP-CTERM system associated)
MKNILSFDIEEYFQVSGLKAAVSRANWDSYPSRVEQNTLKVLDILKRHNVKATFFILGWIAERHAKLVKVIAEAGHEIASHGLEHKLLYQMTSEEFTSDIKKAKDLLESITGQKVRGYRAPSFSLAADDIEKFEILAEQGLTYSSSLFPMKHFRYGQAQSIPLEPFEIKKGDRTIIKEFPMTVIKLLGKHIPAGGGGYFRLYPNFFIRRNFKKVLSESRPVIIYLHPWEFDPEQPRISGAGFGNTFRHYLNLDKTQSKLEMVLQEFEFDRFCDFI